MLYTLKYDIEFRVYRPSFVPQFEVQVRSGSQLPAVAYQGNGFSAFYGVAFAFQQRAAMLVDGYEILVMLYLYQIAGFGCIGTQNDRSVQGCQYAFSRIGGYIRSEVPLFGIERR